MNLRDLKYLIAVAEKRHFGQAAEACHVSQPTLSGQIRKLEEYLGVTLFERTNRSVVITPIGEELLRYAQVAVEQAEAMETLARTYRDPMAGPLRLGAIPTLSPYLMPLILRPLKTRYPRLRLVLTEEITDSLTRRLLEHEIDAALLATTPTAPELEARPLFDEPFWLAIPRTHPLYHAMEITADDLAALDLLLLADGHCLTDQVLDLCRTIGSPRDGEVGDLRAASLETLLQLVGAGFGSTLVPALAIRGAWMTDTGVVVRPLDMPDARRRVNLVYRRSFPRRPLLDALAEVILEHLPNTVKPVRDEATANQTS